MVQYLMLKWIDMVLYMKINRSINRF